MHSINCCGKNKINGDKLFTDLKLGYFLLSHDDKRAVHPTIELPEKRFFYR